MVDNLERQVLIIVARCDTAQFTHLNNAGGSVFPDVAEAIIKHPDGVMVAANVLEAFVIRRAGSSPARGTKFFNMKLPKEFAEELVEAHYNSVFNDGGLAAKFHLYSSSVKSALITIKFLIDEFQFDDTEHSDRRFKYLMETKEELNKMQ